jgi:hypothetical protein
VEASVGIAESGNHDNRNYEDDWGERYQGMLSRNGPSDNYADEANQTHASKLKGKLLLAHGGLDGNVPPYNTEDRNLLSPLLSMSVGLGALKPLGCGPRRLPGLLARRGGGMRTLARVITGLREPGFRNQAA